MPCVFPFNQIKKGSTVIASPADFIYGSGSLSLRGSDSAITTADGMIHNFRSALTPEASCELRGDKRSIDTAYAGGDGQSWPALQETYTLEYIPSRGGTAVQVQSINAIVSVEYNTNDNRSSLSFMACEAAY